MGKNSSGQTVGYKYYAGLHWNLCHGPVDAFIQMRVDKKVVWNGHQNSGSIHIDLPDLFGGDGREGGISGDIDILGGQPTQAKDLYLLGVLGTLVSAYRGFAGVIAKQFYVGNNPYLKEWDFLVQRIHNAEEGATQWYDAKAAIVSPDPSTISVLTTDTNLDANSSSEDGSDGGFTFTCSAGSAIVIQATPNAAAWSYTPSDDYDLTTFPLTWSWIFGIRSPSGVVTTYWPEQYLTSDEAVTAKAGQVITIQATETGTYTFFLWDASVDDNRGRGHYVIAVGQGLSDMNPAHIIRECLTNATWGMGYPDAEMGDSFTAAADTLYGESFGISIEWSDDSAIEDFVNDIMRYIDAVLYVDRTTGKFELKLIRKDYDISTLLHLDRSNIDKITDYAFQSFGELTTTVTVEWFSNQDLVTKMVSVSDGALVAAQQANIQSDQKYPGITNAFLANRIAARDLRTSSTPIRSCTIYAKPEANILQLGDVFYLTWPDFEMTDVIMRVAGISYGDGKSNRVLISATEDIYGVNDESLTTAVSGGGWTNPSLPPDSDANAISFEIPYLEAVQRLGQSTVDALDATAGYVGMASGGVPRAINARVWTDAGAGYSNVGPLDFCPSATLDGDIDRMDTAIVVSNEKSFGVLTPQTWFQIDDEILNFISYDVSTHTVTAARGLLDTVPTTHADGAKILFWDFDNGVDTTEYATGETVNMKLLPQNGGGSAPLGATPDLPITLVGRLRKPYAPGDFKINGEYYPTATQEGDINVSWAHRDRTQQTSGDYIGFTDGNVGPETGVNYRIRAYNADTDFLLSTTDGITGTSHDVPAIDGSVSNVKILLDSYISSIFSFQQQIAVFPYNSSALIEGAFYAKSGAKYSEIFQHGTQIIDITSTKVTLQSDASTAVATIVRLKDEDTDVDLATPDFGYVDVFLHRDSASASQSLGVVLGVTDYTLATLTCWLAAINGTGLNYGYHARYNSGIYTGETIAASPQGASDQWMRAGIFGDRMKITFADTEAHLNIVRPLHSFDVDAGSLVGGLGLALSNPATASLAPYIDTIKVFEFDDPEVINMQFEGANGSQTFVDGHGITFTPDNADPVLSTTSPLSGTSSAVFSNLNGISTPWPYQLDMSGVFTIEFEWEPALDMATTDAIFASANYGGVPGDPMLIFYAHNGVLTFYTGVYGVSNTTEVFTDLIPTIGVKNRVAVTRDDVGVIRVFLEGTKSTHEPTYTTDLTHISTNFQIGSFNPFGGGGYHANKIDNYKVTNACKYTADY